MTARPQPNRRPRDRQNSSGASEQPTFDPQTSQKDLVDGLAEKQADIFGRDLNSSQLRRFFGEVKDMFRRLEQNQPYETTIEPQFKMLRSKSYYAQHKGGGQGVPQSFTKFIDNAVQKVSNEEQFRLFVKHFEAVVGFWYGKYE
ncbi:MAG: type III-A CRISPR-associated protein Csm2 [Phycisphaerae bacterium]